jgi:phosphate/sulfate permease
MYGFMCVAATAALWDNLATALYLPVSTTHTTGAQLYIYAFCIGPAAAWWWNDSACGVVEARPRLRQRKDHGSAQQQ